MWYYTIMSKILIPILILVAFLLVGAGYYYFVQVPKNEQAQKQEMMKKAVVADSLIEDEPKQPSTMMSLRELMAGESQTCTYSTTLPNGEMTTGIVFISDGKVRGDFSISGGDTTPYDGSMIQDGVYLYTWSSALPQGMKIALTSEMKEQTENPSDFTGQTGVNLDQKIDYKCQPWITDSTKFTPPSNITFSEMKLPTGLKPASGSATQTNPNLCSACANLEGEQKTACLTALKCE